MKKNVSSSLDQFYVHVLSSSRKMLGTFLECLIVTVYNEKKVMLLQIDIEFTFYNFEIVFYKIYENKLSHA